MTDPIAYCTVHTGFNELIVAALLTVMFLLGIVYMLAQFMRKPEWEAWVKVQIYHVSISAMLAFGAVWFAGIACGLSFMLAHGDPFTIANDHIGNMINGSLRSTLTMLVRAQVTAEYMAAVFVQLGGATFGTGFAPWPVYRIISNNLQLLSYIIVPFTSSLFAQQIGLQIIQASAFTVLLPIGIVLRAFTVTRDAGSFMIAASIGLFIIFPLTYVMDKMIMEGPAVGDPGSLSPVGPPAPPLNPLTTSCIETTTGYDRPYDQGWYTIYPPGLTVFLDRLPIAPQNMIAPALQCMSYVIPQAAFLPALNLIIVVAFIHSLTKFLTRSFP
jgi:hypothetical protein